MIYAAKWFVKQSIIHPAGGGARLFKWVRIIFRCWQTRAPDDEVKYLESLRRKGAPLLSYAAQKPA